MVLYYKYVLQSFKVLRVPGNQRRTLWECFTVCMLVENMQECENGAPWLCLYFLLFCFSSGSAATRTPTTAPILVLSPSSVSRFRLECLSNYTLQIKIHGLVAKHLPEYNRNPCRIITRLSMAMKDKPNYMLCITHLLLFHNICCTYISFCYRSCHDGQTLVGMNTGNSYGSQNTILEFRSLRQISVVFQSTLMEGGKWRMWPRPHKLTKATSRREE